MTSTMDTSDSTAPDASMFQSYNAIAASTSPPEAARYELSRCRVTKSAITSLLHDNAAPPPAG